jgi:GT2 family glycosyltransferase
MLKAYSADAEVKEKTALVDILIPTYNRPAALGITLAGLVGQTFQDFRVVISDQTETINVSEVGEVKAVGRVLGLHGQRVEFHKHLPRRGLAEQRQFLLDQATAPFALFLDDDVILETYVVESLVRAIQAEKCGFVGSALHGPSFIEDHRPRQEAIEFWQGPVQPETVRPDRVAWSRAALHSAANLYHVQQGLALKPGEQRRYKVAWVGGCAMFDTAKLRAVGGFKFWEELPSEHCGEDVLAQVRVMDRFGGCGILPSGVYHQELPTTVPEREVDAPHYLVIEQA